MRANRLYKLLAVSSVTVREERSVPCASEKKELRALSDSELELRRKLEAWSLADESGTTRGLTGNRRAHQLQMCPRVHGRRPR